MGTCHLKNPNSDKNSSLSINNFKLHYIIGRGGFGKVWKVEMKKNKVFYALKQMSKSRIITKKSVNSVMNERQVLSYLKNQFIVNMVYAFQDRDNLYLVMDLMSGGDLRYHLVRNKKFDEETTKFFTACIISGLEFIHGHGILHRDIKPENLVFDSNGYLRITDFGIARVWRPENADDTSGTPGYMAPEVMCRQNHGISVDYYALGIICYESMMGKRPYNGKSRREIRDKILAKQVQIKREEIPEKWSLEATDFINRLIQRKPSKRMGTNGPTELKTHPWLKDFPWGKLANQEINSPYKPNANEDNFDRKHTLNQFKITDIEAEKQSAILLRRNSVQELFNGYDFEALSLGQQQSSSILTKQLSLSQQNFFSTSVLGASAFEKSPQFKNKPIEI